MAKLAQVYEALDGTRFDTEEQCDAYDACITTANAYREWCKANNHPLGLRSFAVFIFMDRIGVNDAKNVTIAVDKLFPNILHQQTVQQVSHGPKVVNLFNQQIDRQKLLEKRMIQHFTNNPTDDPGFIVDQAGNPLYGYQLAPEKAGYNPNAHLYEVESSQRQYQQMVANNNGNPVELPQARFGGEVLPLSGGDSILPSTAPRNFFNV